jgi:hypothetical protein
MRRWSDSEELKREALAETRARTVLFMPPDFLSREK